jgi:hypothetical protein
MAVDALLGYDPGDCRRNELTATQRDIVRAADWCIVMVGLSVITRQVLTALPPGVAVKNNPDAFSPDLVRALLAAPGW